MMEREILALGVTHRSAPIEVRERLAFVDDHMEDALRRLLLLPRIEEGAIISTCNRVEVLATSSDGDAAVEDLVEFLASNERIRREELTNHISVFRGREAVRHVFRMASSLDSMVVGEPQILGQLKDSYTAASMAGTAGTILHRCFHKSFNVAKRVRTETGIASRAVSVSSAAVELTGKIFDHLDDKNALLIGAGNMGELAARHLLARGIHSIIVTNRTFERARELATQLRGTPVPFEELEEYLPIADVVIGSTAAEEYVLRAGDVRAALQRRKYRPMFLVDMSVPRNFEPAINEIEGVYLYDVDDLSAVAEINRDERGREALKAEAIVDEEVDSFCRWMSGLDAVPTIVALREKAEAVRRAELAKTLSAALRHLNENERAALEAMTSAIVNKILHAPITQLKHQGGREAVYFVAALRQLFEIEERDEH
jgi:glutamyl-tRNA reductase